MWTDVHCANEQSYIVAADWIDVGRELFFCRVPVIIRSCCGTGFGQGGLLGFNEVVL